MNKVMNYSNIHAQTYLKFLELSQIIEAKIKLTLHDYELTHGQYNILRILRGTKGEPITAKIIKQRMIVANPDVTRLVDRLVKKDLVIRVKNPENRREVSISLAAKGHDLLVILDPIMKSAAFNFFEGVLTEQEANEVSVIFEKIRQSILIDTK